MDVNTIITMFVLSLLLLNGCYYTGDIFYIFVWLYQRRNNVKNYLSSKCDISIITVKKTKENFKLENENGNEIN